MTVLQHSPLNNKASCKASGAVFAVRSAQRGGSGLREPSAAGRGAPLRLIPGRDKEPPSHQLCLDSRPHKSSALFGLVLQICQPDQLLKEKGPETPPFPLQGCDNCHSFKGSRADSPAGVVGLVGPARGPPLFPRTPHHWPVPQHTGNTPLGRPLELHSEISRQASQFHKLHHSKKRQRSF